MLQGQLAPKLILVLFFLQVLLLPRHLELVLLFVQSVCIAILIFTCIFAKG